MPAARLMCLARRFLQFTADEAALSVTHVASRGAQGGTAPQADPQASAGSNPSAGAGGAGAGAGAAAATAQGTDGTAAAEEEVAIKAGDVNVSIQANFLEKTASSLYSHFDGHTVTWSEQQVGRCLEPTVVFLPVASRSPRACRFPWPFRSSESRDGSCGSMSSSRSGTRTVLYVWSVCGVGLIHTQ